MEAQRAVAGRVDDLGRQDRGDEGEHVQLGAEPAVLVDALGDRAALAPEMAVAHERQAALARRFGERIGPRALRRRVDADHVVSGVEQTQQTVAAERSLAEERYAEFHGHTLWSSLACGSLRETCLLCRAAIADAAAHCGRRAVGEAVSGDVAGHQRARADHAMPADPHALQDRHVGRHPAAVADRDGARSLPDARRRGRADRRRTRASRARSRRAARDARCVWRSGGSRSGTPPARCMSSAPSNATSRTGSTSARSQLPAPISTRAPRPAITTSPPGVRSACTPAPNTTEAPGSSAKRAAARLLLAPGPKIEARLARATPRQAQPVPAPDRTQARRGETHARRPANAIALACRVLAFAQPEGDEAVRGIVRGETDLDAVARNHANAEAAHAPGELGRDGLPGVELDLIAPAAEDLLDGAGRLDQIFASQALRTPFAASPSRRALCTRVAAATASGGAG